MELDAYEAHPSEGPAKGANIMLKRKTFGGIPPGAGVREDVVLIFEEMEEARNNLAQVRMLIERAPEPNRGRDGKSEFCCLLFLLLPWGWPANWLGTAIQMP